MGRGRGMCGRLRADDGFEVLHLYILTRHRLLHLKRCFVIRSNTQHKQLSFWRFLWRYGVMALWPFQQFQHNWFCGFVVLRTYDGLCLCYFLETTGKTIYYCINVHM